MFKFKKTGVTRNREKPQYRKGIGYSQIELEIQRSFN